jgi:hypothetical protein
MDADQIAGNQADDVEGVLNGGPPLNYVGEGVSGPAVGVAARLPVYSATAASAPASGPPGPHVSFMNCSA